MESVSLVTTCKGRLSYLQESLPTWLAQDIGSDINLEIIVVDFGCPDGTGDWCESLGDARIRVVRAVNNVHTFNGARGRNIGGQASSATLLLFVDADMSLRPDLVSRYIFLMREHDVDLCVAGSQDVHGARFTSGLCMVTRAMFEHVRGYDESIRDYGEEDTDFYRRCRFYGAVEHWVHWDATHRQCSDEERVRFFENKNIKETIARNVAQTIDPSRPVNDNAWGHL